MICPSCKKAGQFNTKANAEVPGRTKDGLIRDAEFWHAKCEYSKCTCQHVIGNVVRLDGRGNSLMMGNSGG